MFGTQHITPLPQPRSEIITTLSPISFHNPYLWKCEFHCHRCQSLQLKQTFRNHMEREKLFVLLLFFYFVELQLSPLLRAIR